MIWPSAGNTKTAGGEEAQSGSCAAAESSQRLWMPDSALDGMASLVSVALSLTIECGSTNTLASPAARADAGAASVQGLAAHRTIFHQGDGDDRNGNRTILYRHCCIGGAACLSCCWASEGLHQGRASTTA